MTIGGTYDLKVGYSCNNNCIHCVVRPNIENLCSCSKKDLTYKEILDCINSEECRKAQTIVITGGEPTVRKEFIRIIKYIHLNYPKKSIALQTNARKLSPYIKELYNLKVNIMYVVAVHSSDEKVHNLIVGNKNENISPYKETMNSIKEIKKYYKDFKNAARVEIVLSRINYKTLPKTIFDLYSMGINRIGISYPHLDGYYMNHGPEKVREIGLSYNDIQPYIPKIYELAIKYRDLRLSFEEFPRCIWRDSNNKLLVLPKNIDALAPIKSEQISVKYPGQQTKTNFLDTWKKMHSYCNECFNCICKKNCCGVWMEACNSYDDLGVKPINQNEYIEGEDNTCI